MQSHAAQLESVGARRSSVTTIWGENDWMSCSLDGGGLGFKSTFAQAPVIAPGVLTLASRWQWARSLV
jgi:hypothetical protein